jgi:hypothetical protein
MPVARRPQSHPPRPSPRGVPAIIAIAGLVGLVLVLGWSGPGPRSGASAGLVLGPPPVAAGSPGASPDASPGTGAGASPAAGGDTRSAGEGPGLVGSPLLAVGGVVALGLAAAALTLLYVRATGGPGPSR